MDSSQMQSLLRQAKQGDQQALTQLYEHTKGYAYFAAKRYVKNDADIQDILQDAYITAFGKLDTLTDDTPFANWFYKIVTNKALDFVKKKRIIVVPEDAAGDIPDNEELIPSSWLERAEKRRDILHIIDSLPDGQRIAIVLFYLEGLSVAEIAEQMELATGTVKAHLYHGRKAIKAAVLKEEEKGNKLYGVVAVPLLSQLMKMEAQAAAMPQQLSSAILEHTLHSIQAGAASGSVSGNVEAENQVDSVSSAAGDSDADTKTKSSGENKMKIKIGAGILVIALIAGIAFFATSNRQPEVEPVMQTEVSQEEAQTEEEAEPEPEPEPDVEVNFTNATLETMLRSYLGNEDAPIMRSDLAEITELAILGGDVLIVNGDGEYEFSYTTREHRVWITDTQSSLYEVETGIDGCSYYSEEQDDYIAVSRGEWNDFSDFQELRNLESLAIVFSTVEDWNDVSVLLNAESLKELDFTASSLPDIEPLSALSNLEKLSFEFTNVRDFSAVSNLSNLKAFNAEGCDISDISFLSGMNLEELKLFSNEITDISPLASMSNMKEIDLGVNSVSDISPLSGMKNLEKFYCDMNQIQDISPLAGAHNLTHLDVGFNLISDISMLENLTQLEHLALYNNQITDVSIVREFTKLTTLYLTSNQIADISPLSQLVNLKWLNISDNPITSIEIVRGMPNLTDLRVYSNPGITDISPVAGLTELTHLELGGCSISDISALANLTKLEYLTLYNNPVSDWSPVAHVDEVVR